MDWKTLGERVAKSAPILGTILGGPAGGLAGALVASAFGTTNDPDAIDTAITADPGALVKLRQIEADNKKDLQSLAVQAEANRLAADTSVIQSVNATMQAETKAEHWPSYTWRPYNGFIFGTMFIGVYFVLPLLRLPVPSVPTEAWIAMGAVLGVASWFRGKAQADVNNPAPVKG